MGLSLATAYVTARGDVSQVAGDFQAGKGQVEQAATSLQSSVNRILGMIGIGLSIGAIVSEMRQGIALAERQIDAEARVAAVVKGTGMAAGFTADQLKAMASEMQSITTIGDEEILESMAMLLTFKSVQGDVFKSAMDTMGDMKAVMGSSLSGAAMQLGRALEDPIRGISALRRTGVSFSEEQKAQIKLLQESGKLQEAQALVLGVVRDQLGDVAEAMAKTDAGKLKQARNVLGDLQEELGKKVIPLQIKFVELQQKWVETLTNTVAIAGTWLNQNKELASALGAVGTSIAILIGILIASKIATYGLTAAFVQLKLAMAMMIAHPVVAVLAALAVVAGVLAIGWAKMNAMIKEGYEISAKFVEKGKEEEKALTDQVLKLRELSKEQGLSNEQMDEAQRVIDDLTSTYGDLGLQIDRTTGEIKGLSGAQAQLAEANKRVRVTQLKVQLIDLTRQYNEAKTNSYQFWRDQDYWAEEARVANEKLIAVQLELFELQRNPPELPGLETDKLKEFEDASSQAVRRASEAAAEMKKSLFEEIGELDLTTVHEQFETLRDRVEAITMEFPELAEAAKKFLDLEWKKTPMGEAEKQLADDATKMKENISKLTEQMATPFEKATAELDRLQKLREAGLNKETYKRALLGVQEELEGKLTTSVAGPSGRFGFEQYGKSLQDMLLKTEDPQKKTAANTAEANKLLGEIKTEIAGLNGANGAAVFAK